MLPQKTFCLEARKPQHFRNLVERQGLLDNPLAQSPRSACLIPQIFRRHLPVRIESGEDARHHGSSEWLKDGFCVLGLPFASLLFPVITSVSRTPVARGAYRC